MTGLILPWLQGLQRNRWICFTAATWMEATAGLSYMFGLYSESFKTVLGYNQEMVDGIGMAKDLGGNAGITSGFLGDYAPNWVVLLVGAAHNFIGYGMIWLVLTRRISNQSFWAICFYIAIGTNGATFFNTVSLVTNVKNFPNSRGPVVGILKGYIGLSGAILTQIYLALYAPNKESFLLLSSYLPVIVAFLVIPLIHPLLPVYEPEEQQNMLYVLAVGVFLAFFLFGASTLGEYFRVSSSVNVCVSILSILILMLPLVIGMGQEWERCKARAALNASSSSSIDEFTNENLDSLDATEDSSLLLSSRKMKKRVIAASGNTSRPEEVPFAAASQTGVKSAASRPMRGEDHSLAEAVATIDFWLIVFAMVFASGSGLTAINNLGQIGKSLGYSQESIGVFVSLMSIWNFLGRVGGGFVSEHFVREHGLPRPLFMAATQAIMTFGHILFAWSFPGSIYVASALVGLCYGAQWGIMPAVTSEVFGLRYFSTLYNWMTMTNPTGSFLLSVCVAGYLYDMEAQQQHSKQPSAPSPALPPSLAQEQESFPCSGVHCFRLTFLIMAFVCLLAMACSLALSLLSRQHYSAEFAKRQRLKEIHLEDRAQTAGPEDG